MREHLLVERKPAPSLRFDLCSIINREGFVTPEAWATREAIWWNEKLVVGFAERVYIVGLPSLSVSCINLAEYFRKLYPSDEWLLVASGSDVIRIDLSGRMMWRSQNLAIDGIRILSVSNGIISGEGDDDPPDGWRPFRLSLTDGSAIP
jgi:hypothetical protein